MDRPSIVLGGGSRSWKVIAAPAILLALPGVSVVEGLAGAAGAGGTAGAAGASSAAEPGADVDEDAVG